MKLIRLLFLLVLTLSALTLSADDFCLTNQLTKIDALVDQVVKEKVGNVKKVLNSNMDHAQERAVERAGFATEKEARLVLQELSKNIEANGLPRGTILDPSKTDRIIVPGFGDNGAVVYKFKNGKLTLMTVLEWRSK